MADDPENTIQIELKDGNVIIELIGGSDIALEMFQSGELQSMFDEGSQSWVWIYLKEKK